MLKQSASSLTSHLLPFCLYPYTQSERQVHMLGTKYDRCDNHSQHQFPPKVPQSVNPEKCQHIVGQFVFRFISFYVFLFQLKDNTHVITY